MSAYDDASDKFAHLCPIHEKDTCWHGPEPSPLKKAAARRSDRMTLTDEECYSILHGPEYSNYGQLRAAFRAGVERAWRDHEECKQIADADYHRGVERAVDKALAICGWYEGGTAAQVEDEIRAQFERQRGEEHRG
jgi:hypothetical protein